MRVVIRPKMDKALRRGYPWIFSNQIARVEGRPASGDVVEIAGDDGHLFGLGLFHARSLIGVRFLTSDVSAAIDAAFFRDRVRRAVEMRAAAFRDETHCRLIFGESDGMPGTIVDRYGDVVTWTTISLGMEQRREEILDAIEEIVRPAAVIERNDTSLRPKDDLEERTGVLRGTYEGPVEIVEDGVRFSVDVMGGPKTGFFIDQRLHRLAVRRFAPGRRVLDVFSADGGFGLHAARAGAERVRLLDSSRPALDRAARNAEANGVADRIDLEQADALERMGRMADEGQQFDLIILDPPAFAPSKRHIDVATKAYQRINISAFRMLAPGGILATSSCSQAVSEADFLRTVRYSARRAGVSLRQLFRGSQPPDHPILEAMPETNYLKFYILQILDDLVPVGA
jgi:23S rRNA (cytosine1962-C5)-methyltransferase